AALREAETQLNAARGLNPSNPRVELRLSDVHNQLGTLYMIAGREELGHTEFEECRRLRTELVKDLQPSVQNAEFLRKHQGILYSQAFATYWSQFDYRRAVDPQEPAVIKLLSDVTTNLQRRSELIPFFKDPQSTAAVYRDVADSAHLLALLQS